MGRLWPDVGENENKAHFICDGVRVCLLGVKTCCMWSVLVVAMCDIKWENS